MTIDNYYGRVGLFSLMLFSGYLTVKEKISDNEYLLKIPNYEVKSFFSKVFLELAEINNDGLIFNLDKALKKENV